MKAKRYWLVVVLFGLMIMAIHFRPAGAETTICTPITSLPYTITTQGIYCLTTDLSTGMTSGNAITINANNVLIDLNGHKLGGQAAGLVTEAHGIHAYKKKNIAIKNGIIRGFYRGIVIADDPPYTISQSILIEDIRADLNTYVGIAVHGRGNIVRNVGVVNTGGSTVSSDAWGIVSKGPGARIYHNNIFESKEQGTGLAGGIYVNEGDGTFLANNVSGNTALGTGTSYGILISDSENVIVRTNSVTMMANGILFNAASSGVYMDNAASGCGVAFTAVTPANVVGSNNIKYP